MTRFCQGDAPAFDALFDRHGERVRRYLSRVCGDGAVAEDLTQATFLSVVRARGYFRAGARFKPWLYAIAMNAARDFRRRHKEELTPTGELPAQAGEDASSAVDPGLERVVRAALAQLPDGQREAIVLHRFEGLSFSEVGEALGISETAAKVRAHRGYEQLRVSLSKLWGDVQ